MIRVRTFTGKETRSYQPGKLDDIERAILVVVSRDESCILKNHQITELTNVELAKSELAETNVDKIKYSLSEFKDWKLIRITGQGKARQIWSALYGLSAMDHEFEIEKAHRIKSKSVRATGGEKNTKMKSAPVQDSDEYYEQDEISSELGENKLLKAKTAPVDHFEFFDIKLRVSRADYLYRDLLHRYKLTSRWGMMPAILKLKVKTSIMDLPCNEVRPYLESMLQEHKHVVSQSPQLKTNNHYLNWRILKPLKQNVPQLTPPYHRFRKVSRICSQKDLTNDDIVAVQNQFNTKFNNSEFQSVIELVCKLLNRIDLAFKHKAFSWVMEFGRVYGKTVGIKFFHPERSIKSKYLQWRAMTDAESPSSVICVLEKILKQTEEQIERLDSLNRGKKQKERSLAEVADSVMRDLGVN